MLRAPRYFQAWAHHQMVSSMGRAHWRSQPWTLSSVMVQCSAHLRQSTWGKTQGLLEPDRARGRPRVQASSIPSLQRGTVEDASRAVSLGQVGLVLGPDGDGATGQRSGRVTDNQQGKSGHLVCHQTGHCLQALTLQPHHIGLGGPGDKSPLRLSSSFPTG